MYGTGSCRCDQPTRNNHDLMYMVASCSSVPYCLNSYLHLPVHYSIQYITVCSNFATFSTRYHRVLLAADCRTTPSQSSTAEMQGSVWIVGSTTYKLAELHRSISYHHITELTPYTAPIGSYVVHQCHVPRARPVCSALPASLRFESRPLLVT